MLFFSSAAQEIWLGLGEFDEVDADHDDVISRDELRAAVERRLGKEPSEQVFRV